MLTSPKGALSVLCSHFSSACLVVFLWDAVINSPAVKKEIGKPSLLLALAASPRRQTQLGIMKWAPPPASFIITRWTSKVRSPFSAPGFCFLCQHEVCSGSHLFFPEGLEGQSNLIFRARSSTPGAKSILFFSCHSASYFLMSLSMRASRDGEETDTEPPSQEGWALQNGKKQQNIRTCCKCHHFFHSHALAFFFIEAEYHTWVGFLCRMTWMF